MQKFEELVLKHQLTPTEYTPDTSVEEDESNLLDLLIVILRHKKLIVLVVFLAGILAVLYTWSQPNIYRSECTIAPTGQPSRAGRLAALGGLSGMVAQEAGVYGGASSLEKLEVVLKSRELTNTVVQQHNLIPILFKKSWDSENKRWKLKKPPTLQNAYASIQKIMNSKSDIKKNIMELTVEHSDPRMAQAILIYYVEGLSEYLRKEVLDDTEAKQVQLYTQLAKTADPMLKTRLYDVIADEIEKETLARVQRYYGFSVLDPPFAPERKFKPKRAMICLLSVVVAFFGAVILAFVLEYTRNLHRHEDPKRLANLRDALRLKQKQG